MLQTEYVKLFRWVQESRGLICVPHSSSITGLDVGQSFVGMCYSTCKIVQLLI